MKFRFLLAAMLAAFFAIAAACGGDGGAPTAEDQRPANGAVGDQITDSAPCPGALSWDQAYENVGERATVQGPVVGTRYASGSSGQPTFLNVGKPFPDNDRFTVVIWGDTRDNFPFAPEVEYDNKTICVTGLIETFEGVPQIIADTSSDIEIVD